VHKQPFLIPINLGLLNADGTSLGDTQLLVLNQAEQTLVFDNITQAPVPSLLRGFSAPVHLVYDYSEAELLTLLAHDTDAFNQWEAAQRLSLNAALKALSAEPTASPLPETLVRGLQSVLRHPSLDAAFKELVLTLPSETYIAEQCSQVDPQRIHQVREAMRMQLAVSLHDDWVWAYTHHANTGSYQTDALSCGRRALRGLALVNLCLAGKHQGDNTWPTQALQQFDSAHNMTERMHALSALVHIDHPFSVSALSRFHAMFKREELVLDKWFALQASASGSQVDVLTKVRQLMQHPDFHIRNPNRARSLVASYCANAAAFHRSDASGYVFWSERVLELDSFNPQVAARLARSLDRWRKLVEPYRSAAHEAIRRVAAKDDLSADVREVINSALED
jgi:aminopeptidase N